MKLQNHLFMARSPHTDCIFSRLKGEAFSSGNKDECLTKVSVCVTDVLVIKRQVAIKTINQLNPICC